MEALELIHTDINGPISLIIMVGYKYLITFINDYSRYRWIQLLTEKFEYLHIFNSFKAIVELKLRKKIRYVNLDKCGEYYGRYSEASKNPDPLTKCLQEHCIETSYTLLDTPEHNGIAERRNETLMDIMRCMLTHSSLPNFL